MQRLSETDSPLRWGCPCRLVGTRSIFWQSGHLSASVPIPPIYFLTRSTQFILLTKTYAPYFKWSMCVVPCILSTCEKSGKGRCEKIPDTSKANDYLGNDTCCLANNILHVWLQEIQWVKEDVKLILMLLLSEVSFSLHLYFLLGPDFAENSHIWFNYPRTHQVSWIYVDFVAHLFFWIVRGVVPVFPSSNSWE